MSIDEKIKGPYRILSTKIVYKNPWITLREDQVIRPGGSKGIFGIVEMISGSSVLPLDEDNYVYLVQEYKYGVEKESIEVISGAIEVNETPLEAAKRELSEELGIIAKEWIGLGCVDPFTTVVKSPNYMFLAKGLEESVINPDEGEILNLVKMKMDDAVSYVMRGEITHSASCVLILKAARLLKIT